MSVLLGVQRDSQDAPRGLREESRGMKTPMFLVVRVL